eukprot:669950-Pelagomonas_calceolata.AAC.1
MKINSTEKLSLEKSCLRLTGYHHGSQKKQKESGLPSTSTCKDFKSSRANSIPSFSQRTKPSLQVRETRIELFIILLKKKKKLRRQRKFSLHQLRKERHIGSKS